MVFSHLKWHIKNRALKILRKCPWLSLKPMIQWRIIGHGFASIRFDCLTIHGTKKIPTDSEGWLNDQPVYPSWSQWLLWSYLRSCGCPKSPLIVFVPYDKENGHPYVSADLRSPYFRKPILYRPYTIIYIYIHIYVYIYMYGNDIFICGGRARPQGPGGSLKYLFVYLKIRIF